MKYLENAIAVLEGAKKRIAKGWVKGRSAEDAKGNGVSPRSKKAVRFCAYGAMQAGTKSYNVLEVAEELFSDANFKTPITLNDYYAKDKRDVTSAFTKSINLGKKKLKIRTKV